MKRLIAVFVASAAVSWAQLPASAPQLAARPGVVGVNVNTMYNNIELTVYVVSGLAQPQAGAATELPDDLAATMNQMRGVFSYKTYRLVNAFTLRGRNGGGAEMAGDLPMNGWTYDFKYGSANVFENSPGIVHINRLRLEIAKRGNVLTRSNLNGTSVGPATATTMTVGSNAVALVSTDLDVKEGQKTVVGQSAVNGTDALFLVIVPKVVTQ
ncbi:MAG TPA: hypothetical protein VGN17_27485 [Bryobacteraceae bacterium]|jgi:hypothetical protein